MFKKFKKSIQKGFKKTKKIFVKSSKEDSKQENVKDDVSGSSESSSKAEVSEQKSLQENSAKSSSSKSVTRSVKKSASSSVKSAKRIAKKVKTSVCSATSSMTESVLSTRSKIARKLGLKRKYRRRKVQKRDEDVVYSWMGQCYGEEILPNQNTLNMVFAPISTLFCLLYVYCAMEGEQRRALLRKLNWEREGVHDIAAIFEEFTDSTGYDLIAFHHIFVGESNNFSRPFLDKIEKMIGSEAIQCIEISTLQEWLDIGTNAQLNFSDLSADEALGVAAAGIRSRFHNDLEISSPIVSQFAVTYQIRQKHSFFAIKGMCRNVRTRTLEIWSIPLSSKSGCVLVLIRPFAIGSSLEFREKLDGKELHEFMRMVSQVEPHDTNILIPNFEIFNQEELYRHWIEKEHIVEIPPDVPRVACPKMREIIHWARIRVDGEGIHYERGREKTSNPVTSPSDHPKLDTLNRHEKYQLRLDSPFMCAIIRSDTLTPLVAGFYAGSPAHSPDDIRQTTPAVHRKAEFRKPGKTRDRSGLDRLLNRMYSNVYNLPTLGFLLYSSVESVKSTVNIIRK